VDADLTLKNPSRSVMNNLARSVLALYTYDDNPDETDIDNVVKQCLMLIARLPVIVATPTGSWRTTTATRASSSTAPSAG
jgi:hypothetical protein